jgi:sugar phosphate isomerase/epimerase
MKIAFNTANLVARATNYRFELRNWADQHRKTVAATDEKEWLAICGEIAAGGYKAVELWQAHADPSVMSRQRAGTWKRILDDHGLQPIGYAGTLSRETVEICAWLGIPAINGGLGELSPADATALCRAAAVRFNVENHPEKSASEILARIDGGNEWLGVCIDTGWLGTQGVNAAEAIRDCRSVLRHLHVKDVEASGSHKTCLLGAGIVDLPRAIQTLKDIGYAGWYSWEDEAEDRNPMLTAIANRRWLEERLR